MSFPHDPFGRSRLPESAQLPTDFDTREHNVRLLREIADALIADRRPSREAELYLAGALDSYLTKTKRGGIGCLERDHLKITPPKGSRLTAAELLKRRHPDEPSDDEAERDFPHDSNNS